MELPHVYLAIGWLFISLLAVHSAPDVQLSTGIARGQDKQARETLKPYFVYYGISFAEPPEGDLRFSPPLPFVGDGRPNRVITSNTFRPTCYQVPAWREETMSEDCLHVNIFSPADVGPGRPSKKVMVWVHGGGFMVGSASAYSPSRLVTDRNVIVVTIQYRLAAYGFLSSGDDAVPGNMGLRDQLLAIKWVKDNIRLFGGDPNDLTVFGESAGSASVAALCLTPGAKGLFTKAIMQSGTLLSPWAMIRDPQERFYRFARQCGCLPWIYNPWNKVSYHNNVLRCLKRKPATELADCHPKDDLSSIILSKGFWEMKENFGLVVDNDFLPKAPETILRDKAYLQTHGVLDRSYVIGNNNNEGILAAMVIPKDLYGNMTFPSNVRSLIRSIVRGYLPLPVDSDILNVVDFMYTFPRDPDGNIPLQKVLDLQSDNLFTVPMMVFARALVNSSSSTPVYMYLFDSEPKLKDPDGPLRGTNHGMDLYYEFDGFDEEYSEIDNFYADKDPVKFPIISNAFRGYVTDFAKTGSPVPNQPGAWPRFDTKKELYLAISSQPEVREHLYAERVSLWTDFLPKRVVLFRSGRSGGRPAFG